MAKLKIFEHIINESENYKKQIRTAKCDEIVKENTLEK